jgi:hypothetical protein
MAWELDGELFSEGAYSATFRGRTMPSTLSPYFVRNSDGTDISKSGTLTTKGTNPLTWDTDTSAYDQPCYDGGDGLILEASATNLLLHSGDFSQAAWVATNITKETTSIVNPFGATVTTGRLTATAANGTLLQAVTSASATRAFSIYMRRVTGAGNIDMTVNGGTNWTTKTLTANWQRFDISAAAITNPSVGVRIVASGDVIDVAMAQLENNSFPTSPVPTVGSAVTRAAAYIGNVPLADLNLTSKTNDYSFHVAVKMPYSSAVTPASLPQVLLAVGDGTSTEYFHVAVSAAGTITFLKVSALGSTTLSASGLTWAAGDVLNIRGAIGAADGGILRVNAESPLTATGTNGKNGFATPLTGAYLGSRQYAVEKFANATLLGCTIYDHALSDAELAALDVSAFDAPGGRRLISSPIRSLIRPLIRPLIIA